MIYSIGERKAEFRGDCFVAENATVIGSVVVEDNASIWFQAVVRGDNDLIVIGRSSNVQDGAILHTDPGIELRIDADVTVGHMAMLHGCSIGQGTLVGIKSVILNHAVVGKHCLIGANALITEGKNIPDGSLVMGAPARVVRPLTAQEIAALEGSAKRYVDNARRYRKQLQSSR
jgi:carbonic anhydrase/acetyltransferase-like protein (isoleucine patch superfamily)